MTVIKEVWGLKLNHELLGVRVMTLKNEYFDIDIDVYKKQLKLDPSNLKSLPLIEYGDLFMTEDEFNTGQLISDASENTGILHAVNTFVRSNNVTDPLYIAKRKKAIVELRQKYYSYLPNSFLDEFAEYHLDNFDGNANIYSSLTKPQMTLVKDYFRWRSKLIFDEQKASKLLRTSLKKAKDLGELMGDAKDWYYDGTVDTGFKGGSHCELGHALRYEHYAFSPSLSKQIIFGSTCMSDFFELDPVVLKNITQAQETLLKEVKSIVFVMKTDKSEEYGKDYKDLWEVLKFFKGQFNDAIPNGAGWSRFIGGFAKEKLPLTRSMLHAYKNLLWKWTEAKDEAEENAKEDLIVAQNKAKEAEKLLLASSTKEEVFTSSDSFESLSSMQPPDFDDDLPFDEDLSTYTNRPPIKSYEEFQKDAALAREKEARSLPSPSSGLDPEIERQFVEIEKARDDGRLKSNLFAFTIMPTIRKTGFMSPKQKTYIDEAYNKIQKVSPSKPAVSDPFSVRQSAKAPESSQLPVEQGVKATDPLSDVESTSTPNWGAEPSSTPYLADESVSGSSWVKQNIGTPEEPKKQPVKPAAPDKVVEDTTDYSDIF
jgi:hypothetical protein